MKRFLLKVLTGVILMAFLLFCHIASVDAARYTKTLNEDTRMTPPGVIVATWSEIPKFKKGTDVMLNEYGEVFEGILAENVKLPYETGTSQDSIRTAYTPLPMYFYSYTTEPKYRVLPFKGGTKVTFNDKGEVIKGIISSSSERIDLNQTNHILVSDGEISFHKNGMLATCSLASASYLRPVGWQQILTENDTDNSACSGLVEFKSRKPIVLNEKGEVVKGTLNKDTKLLSPVVSFRSPDGIKVYEAGTEVEFDDKGVVVKALKATTAVN
ncbi:hypothetical protein SPSIL_027420 [Sporomusa silvacetica DSM 10669]|uniref:MORN repeat variant n=1 Tax=Sporomusa silvacetica DSM 10669 TaxID=1123289 RepID=A0ABZ3IMH5_9FIRM|nr:hypothetical protein [Sporomusa silvacetica]OZC21957.1 hypothetical protein SPSIL_08830 [Sporomusa silvacetica DSM 10669]